MDEVKIVEIKICKTKDDDGNTVIKRYGYIVARDVGECWDVKHEFSFELEDEEAFKKALEEAKSWRSFSRVRYENAKKFADQLGVELAVYEDYSY